MHYRRTKATGGTFFFTVNLADRQSCLLIREIDVLRDAIRKVRHTHPFKIVAMVVLPEHLHTIWTLPAGDTDYAIRWSLIKAGFSRALSKDEAITPARRHKRERGIWQRRYWEHWIRDDEDLARHVDYIHINPVKHSHVTASVDWPYSSIHRYIRNGLLPANWAVVELGAFDTGFGE